MGFFKSIFKKARRRKDKDRNNRDTIVLPFQNPPPQSPPPWDQTQPSHAPRSDTSFPPPTQLHSWQLHTVPEESRSNYSSPVPDPPAHPAHVRPPSNTSQQHGGSKSRVESHLTIDADARPPTWFFQRPVWPHPQRRPREKSVATHITLPRQSRAPTWFFQRPVWPMPKSEKHHDVVEAEDQPSWVHHRPVWPEPQSSRPKESVVVQRPPSNEEPRRVSREQYAPSQRTHSSRQNRSHAGGSVRSDAAPSRIGKESWERQAEGGSVVSSHAYEPVQLEGEPPHHYAPSTRSREVSQDVSDRQYLQPPPPSNPRSDGRGSTRSRVVFVDRRSSSQDSLPRRPPSSAVGSRPLPQRPDDAPFYPFRPQTSATNRSETRESSLGHDQALETHTVQPPDQSRASLSRPPDSDRTGSSHGTARPRSRQPSVRSSRKRESVLSRVLSFRRSVASPRPPSPPRVEVPYSSETPSSVTVSTPPLEHQNALVRIGGSQQSFSTVSDHTVLATPQQPLPEPEASPKSSARRKSIISRIFSIRSSSRTPPRSGIESTHVHEIPVIHSSHRSSTPKPAPRREPTPEVPLPTVRVVRPKLKRVPKKSPKASVPVVIPSRNQHPRVVLVEPKSSRRSQPVIVRPSTRQQQPNAWVQSPPKPKVHSQPQPKLYPQPQPKLRPQPQPQVWPQPEPQLRQQPVWEQVPAKPKVRPQPQPLQQPPIQSQKDSNQANQSNEHYAALRAQANAAGDAMGRSFDASKQAFQRGDGAMAKQLSEEGKAHRAEMERLHAEAGAWIYGENNKNLPPYTVDLHGLYVKEAVEYTERALEKAREKGATYLRVIVGKGIHSTVQGPKIKPAIEELMRNQGIEAEFDPLNDGVLVVYPEGKDRMIQAINSNHSAHKPAASRVDTKRRKPQTAAKARHRLSLRRSLYRISFPPRPRNTFTTPSKHSHSTTTNTRPSQPYAKAVQRSDAGHPGRPNGNVSYAQRVRA